MPMNELVKMSFFTLLSKPSEDVLKEEMEIAYGALMEQIKVISNSDDYAYIFRELIATRIELASLSMLSFYEQGGGCY